MSQSEQAREDAWAEYRGDRYVLRGAVYEAFVYAWDASREWGYFNE